MRAHSALITLNKPSAAAVVYFLAGLCTSPGVFAGDYTGDYSDNYKSSEPPHTATSAATKVDELNTALEEPWGMAFLPDGRLLVTQKAGKLSILDASGVVIVDSSRGLTTVSDRGQGGLLDVAISPAFGEDQHIYWSFSEAGLGSDRELSGTAIARGRLRDASLEDVEVIFRQTPKLDGHNHYGSRLVFAPDGKLFATLGERQSRHRAKAQGTPFGTTIRLNPDGSIPADNPASNGQASAVWSFGHRNPQGAAITIQGTAKHSAPGRQRQPRPPA